ncbi:hypothetical protein [Oceanibacterium hippocampi]|uniref:Uncharacterized protein n=1 Tax=Oceanibacterium hippocampi TaxID=745714 RepID=A0A1Y5RYF0_9PROT|nr:hypothetical protein [Oceanibacterium hippocampi]SLN25461.1 hypothetical protein OCH7691_00751 [Oceanibacterium hippocampi]
MSRRPEDCLPPGVLADFAHALADEDPAPCGTNMLLSAHLTGLPPHAEVIAGGATFTGKTNYTITPDEFDSLEIRLPAGEICHAVRVELVWLDGSGRPGRREISLPLERQPAPAVAPATARATVAA